MSESRSHKTANRRAAGSGGRTETKLPGNRRLDAMSKGGHRATEVERSGNPKNLEKAARRLRASGAKQKVLQVPQNDMSAATKALRNASVGGTVKNMSGTKARRVPPG